jgi:hypothetical protein
MSLNHDLKAVAVEALQKFCDSCGVEQPADRPPCRCWDDE